MYNAKIASRCFTAAARGRYRTTRRNTGLGVGDAFVGDAECAATHT
jgi:hypothetical protein